MTDHCLKYIIYFDWDAEPVVVIFSRHVVHRDIVRRLGCGDKLISAGFFTIIAGEPVCYGRAESIDTDSSPEDDIELIRKELA